MGACYDQELVVRTRSRQMNMKRSIQRLAIATILSGVLPVAIHAQQAPPVPAPSPQPSTPKGLVVTQTATETQARPVYGVQGVLVQTLDGRTVSSQNEDQTFNPASAVKL